jgi:hypothetical protein
MATDDPRMIALPACAMFERRGVAFEPVKASTAPKVIAAIPDMALAQLP